MIASAARWVAAAAVPGLPRARRVRDAPRRLTCAATRRRRPRRGRWPARRRRGAARRRRSRRARAPGRRRSRCSRRAALRRRRAAARRCRQRRPRSPTRCPTTAARRCSRPGPSSACSSQLPRRAARRAARTRARWAPRSSGSTIASLKREAITLRSALAARGVVLRDVVAFYRVWNGFAATVSTRDIPRLTSPGVRVRTVRRAYPATERAGAGPGRAPIEPAGLSGQPPVAVLDTGVDSKALDGHADPGYDAVDRDRDPAPGRDARRHAPRDQRDRARGRRRRGRASACCRSGSPRCAPRAARSRPRPTTDELIAGLEHAVDPNGDGDTSDHVPVALVGVNAPYAGFSNSPEAEAVKGAAGLGTLVVAPAGNEGAAAPGSGTIGSPASAPRRARRRRARRPRARRRASTLDAGGERSPRPPCWPATRRDGGVDRRPGRRHRPGRARRGPDPDPRQGRDRPRRRQPRRPGGGRGRGRRARRAARRPARAARCRRWPPGRAAVPVRRRHRRGGRRSC